MKLKLHISKELKQEIRNIVSTESMQYIPVVKACANLCDQYHQLLAYFSKLMVMLAVHVISHNYATTIYTKLNLVQLLLLLLQIVNHVNIVNSQFVL